MKASGTLKRVWRWVKWPVYILLAAYVLLVAWDVVRITNSQTTAAEVAKIHAQKLTLADVEGKNLPPIPDQAENDATVAGLDKNNNGVRDDVELAIFKKYPNSAKIRAAELQYGMAIQLMITKVFNSGSWVAAVQEVTRGHNCVAKAVPHGDDFKIFIDTLNSRIKEVDNSVVNTDSRRKAQDQSYSFTVGYGDEAGGSVCDIELNTLPN